LKSKKFKGGRSGCQTGLQVSCFNDITQHGQTLCGDACDAPGTDSNFASCITYDTLKQKF